MTSATVRSGFDTWLGSEKPTTPHPQSHSLLLRGSGAWGRALLYFKNPAPQGATVLSATLRVYTRSTSSGARTLHLRRVTSGWKVSSATWEDRPTYTTDGQVTKSVDSLPPATPLDFDVTALVQTMTNGAPNYGFQIDSSASAYHALASMERGGTLKPTLTVEWSDAPTKPTTLNPSDGTVSETAPTVQFDYTDVSGDTALTAVQVQVEPGDGGTIPSFDSGSVLTSVPELDLSSTAFGGLVEGEEALWRVRVQDGAGLWSEWSDFTAMTYRPKGVLTVTDPTGGVVYETTPPVLWSLTGQTAYQVLVFDDADPTRPLHDSGRRASTTTAYTIPTGVLKDGRLYTVEVRGWDEHVERAATPGAPTYSSASASFVVTDDATVSGPDTLTATADETPFVVLEWTRGTAPDSWTLYEDGLPIVADLSPADTLVSGSTYRYSHAGARPGVEHTYSVRAVVNGRMSPPGPTDTATPNPVGIWLVDPSDGLHVTLWGDDEGTWNMADDATVHAPINSTEVVRIVSGMRGLDGSLSGALMEGFGKTFEEQQADLYTLKARPTARLRLVASDVNIEALVGNVRVAPRPVSRRGRVVKAVSFDFWQVGALPFDPII